MQRQVQERVEASVLGPIVGVEVALARLEQRVIFGMQRDDFDDDALEIGERRRGAILLPRGEEEFAGLVP
jgi:hypothetical protein